MQKDIGKALIFAIGCNAEESVKKKRERKHKKMKVLYSVKLDLKKKDAKNRGWQYAIATIWYKF